jgi:TRAP-type C4-dicarboxylate transport system substrate-binding protein
MGSLLACSLLVSGLGQNLVYGADKEVELKFQSVYFDAHSGSKYAFRPWIDRVHNLSGGKLRVVSFPPNTIVQFKETFDGAKSGLVDIGSSLCGQNPGKFPLSDSLEMPFLFPSATAGSVIQWELFQRYPEWQEEFKGTKVLWLWMSAPLHIFTTKKPVRTLEDMKGMKMIGYTPMMLETIRALGASAVQIAPPEAYLALERGMADGVVMAYPGAASLKIFEVAKYAAEANLHLAPFYAVMNEKKYNELPSDLKKVIDETTGVNMSRACGEALDRGDSEDAQLIKEKGVNIYIVPRKEKERWIEAVMPLREEVLKKTEAKGYKNTREIINAATKLAEKYEGK